MRRCLVLLVVIFSVFVPGVEGESQRLTLEAIFAGDELLSENPTNLTWHPDGETLLYLQESPEGAKLWRESAATGERRRVVGWKAMLDELKGLRPNHVEPPMDEVSSAVRARYDLAVNPNGSTLVGLVAGDLYRLDLATGEARFLTEGRTLELFPTFDPAGDRLAFVREGDLWVLDLESRTEVQITDRGDQQTLGNGIADWVYEEELDVRRSFWWSPDGQKLLFVQYDTARVGRFTLTDELALYARVERQSYPKAGAANPVVRLGVVPVAAPREVKWVSLGEERDVYLPRAGWCPDGSVWYQVMNRDQTALELRVADPDSGVSRVLLREHDPAWVNVRNDMLFLDDKTFVWGSDRDGWRHLYLYNVDGTLKRRLTSGSWQVEEVYGTDASGSNLLVLATEKDPRERHVYTVPLADGSLDRLTTEAGTHQALLAPGGAMWVDTWSSLDTPHRIEVMGDGGRRLRTLATGAIPALDVYQLVPFELGTIDAADGTTLYTGMVRPSDFDPKKKYPVVLYVYGGPHAQIVTNEWGKRRQLFFNMLAQRGMVVFWLDNRGTWGRGKAFETIVHRRLGDIEDEDQLAGLTKLMQQPWVDRDRIAVYGGSYGGFMALTCMLRHPEVFRAGIAYAPVTDWRLYDSVYAERYMDRPQDNPEGYERSAPIIAAEKLAGRLLLVHGTMDNNVHMQNTLRLVDKLASAGLTFDLMLYPRVRHGVRVSHFKLQFHRLKTEFLERHLLGEP